MQEQMDKVSRDMGILKKNQKEILEIKNSITETNVFDGLISSLDMAEARISEPEDMSTEISKTEKQREKMTGRGEKNWNRLSKNVGNYKSCNKGIIGIPEKKEKKKWKKYLKQV